MKKRQTKRLVAAFIGNGSGRSATLRHVPDSFHITGRVTDGLKSTLGREVQIELTDEQARDLARHIQWHLDAVKQGA